MVFKIYTFKKKSQYVKARAATYRLIFADLEMFPRKVGSTPCNILLTETRD